MSRFAKIPVKVPEGVKIEVGKDSIQVTGPKGTLMRKFPDILEIKIEEGILFVTSADTSKFAEAMKGTIRSHIVNMITGVTSFWSKKLEVVGTGYRAEVKGNDLVLTVGYSHPITITAPSGIKFIVEKNVVTVEGADREIVGKIAADVHEVRLPDPYKGKGIRYFGEVLKLKPGKQAAKTTA